MCVPPMSLASRATALTQLSCLVQRETRCLKTPTWALPSLGGGRLIHPDTMPRAPAPMCGFSSAPRGASHLLRVDPVPSSLLSPKGPRGALLLPDIPPSA